MEKVILVALGAALDIVRMIVAPRTQQWLEKRIPWLRDAANRKNNLAMLELRGKLHEQGLNPELAKYASEPVDAFEQRLLANESASLSAFVTVQADSLAAYARTQADMTQYAFDQATSAENILAQLMSRLEEGPDLSPKALSQLRASQEAWQAFVHADAALEADLVAGEGTMHSSIYGMSVYRHTVDRIAHLNQLIDQWRA